MLEDDDNPTVEIPAWDGVPRFVAELWRLTKDHRSAVCSVWTHPEGGELRVTVDGELQLAEATPHTFVLPTLALAWKERWHWMHGWQ